MLVAAHDVSMFQLCFTKMRKKISQRGNEIDRARAVRWLEAFISGASEMLHEYEMFQIALSRWSDLLSSFATSSIGSVGSTESSTRAKLLLWIDRMDGATGEWLIFMFSRMLKT